MFRTALESDVGDIQGGTTQEGIHLGVMAGTLDLLQRGYMGLGTRDGTLRFEPRQIQRLDGLSFPFQFRGTPVRVSLYGGRLTVAAEDDAERTLRVGVGEAVRELAGSQSHTFEL